MPADITTDKYFAEQPSREDAVFLDRIQRYWSCRADDYGRVRREELQSDKWRLWQEEIVPFLPSPQGEAPLRILDIGTGAGFFAILLARASRGMVTGIDICPDMLQQARTLASECACQISFRQMDAVRLDFDDASFDCLLVRNLTWTLLEPAAAYAEWQRVLRPGGVLLNFDADYGAVDFRSLSDDHGRHAHDGIPQTLLQEGEAIRQHLPMSRERRPAWDMEVLHGLGFADVQLDTGLSQRIFRLKDSSYNPVPMFAIRAIR